MTQAQVSESGSTATKPEVEKGAKLATVAPETLEQELSVESIGWLFIQKYYGTYTGELSKLYAFYDRDASLLHDGFPTSNEESETKRTKKVHVASGSVSIKSHFESQSQLGDKSKIVVEGADFQKSVDGSILIVVHGSWKRGASSLWHFVQTFVLKAKEETVYDVANDILKFFDLTENFKKTEIVIEAGKSEEAEKATEISEEPESPSEPEEAEPPVIEEEEKKEEEKETVPEGKVEEEKKEASKPTEVDEKDQSPPQKHTWATLAAMEPKAGTKASIVTTQTVTKTTSAPAKKSVSPPQVPAVANGNGNGKFKKEEWYPIYIKNVEVDEGELKSALVKQFGDIKFFKRTNKAALCDFTNKEDQTKALEARKIVIRNNVILLEQRQHKPFNNRPDAKKDKKPIKKAPVKKN